MKFVGLDCWLYAKRYIWSDDRVELDDLQRIVASFISKGQDIFEEMKDFTLTELKFEVGYWRKANQIHNWFVNNVQEGQDDCKSYSVDIEKLKEFLEIIDRILNEKDKKKQMGLAKELLPSQSGFFFGRTDYDKYYFDELVKTKKIINKVLKIKNISQYDIEYGSSW